jgi:hypothetical protein
MWIVLVLLGSGCGYGDFAYHDGIFRFKPSSTQSLANGSSLTVTHAIMMIAGNGGAIALGTPNITDGVRAGQRCLIVGTSDANTVLFQDEAVLPGSELETHADASRTIGANDSLYVVWTGTRWIELGAAENVNADD